MSRRKAIIKPNSAKTGYECFYEFDGVLYPYESVKTVERINGNICKSYTYDVDTGTVLSQKVSNVISDNNSKAFLYKNGCEVAKDKNMPRIKVLSEGKHILEIHKQYCDYLQVSTGSQHDKRGMVVADLDLSAPENIVDVKQYAQNVLSKHFDNMYMLGISKPSSYQIHLTNGHVQLFWILKDEITIKKMRSRSVKDYDTVRKLFYFENTPLWAEYHRVMQFYAYLLNADHNFTGWQVKNMFITDDVFAGSFKTMWLDGDSYVEDEPENIKMYSFNTLCKEVNDIVKDPAKTEKFLIAIGMSDIKKKEKEQMICDNFLLSKDIQKKHNIHRKEKLVSISEGRNQFVRRKTYEIIRLYRNNIEMNRCRKLVKQELDLALEKYGKLPGTKNTNAYTDADFDRDFRGAYCHAITTYNPHQGYNDEQRERARKQNAAKKNVSQRTMLAILEEHQELIPSTKCNNLKIAKLFAEYNIDAKTPSYQTIANYKKELGFKKDQTKISPKNYKKVDKEYNNCIKRKCELYNTYKDTYDIMSKEKRKEWKKRFSNITSNKKIHTIYKKRKRLTSYLLVIKIVLNEISKEIYLVDNKIKKPANVNHIEKTLLQYRV